MQSNSFGGCQNIASIKVDDDNPIYDSRNDCNAIIDTSKNALIRGCYKTLIPNGVKRIGDLAFSWVKKMTSIIIPDSVVSIGNSAFSGCDNLTSIIIHNSMSIIGEKAFYGCDSLKDITFLGTKVQWNKIEIAASWRWISGISVIHCDDGDIELGEYEME
jgi:hypothetical protein